MEVVLLARGAFKTAKLIDHDLKFLGVANASYNGEVLICIIVEDNGVIGLQLLVENGKILNLKGGGQNARKAIALLDQTGDSIRIDYRLGLVSLCCFEQGRNWRARKVLRLREHIGKGETHGNTPLAQKGKYLFDLLGRVCLSDKGPPAVHLAIGKAAVYAAERNPFHKELRMGVHEINKEKISPETNGKVGQ
jgi:hypothetical protein